MNKSFHITPTNEKFGGAVAIFPQKEWSKTTVGDIFDYYAGLAKGQCGIVHITPMREEQRAKRVDFFGVRDGSSLLEILAWLMKF